MVFSQNLTDDTICKGEHSHYIAIYGSFKQFEKTSFKQKKDQKRKPGKATWHGNLLWQHWRHFPSFRPSLQCRIQPLKPIYQHYCAEWDPMRSHGRHGGMASCNEQHGNVPCRHWTCATTFIHLLLKNTTFQDALLALLSEMQLIGRHGDLTLHISIGHCTLAFDINNHIHCSTFFNFFVWAVGSCTVVADQFHCSRR